MVEEVDVVGQFSSFALRLTANSSFSTCMFTQILPSFASLKTKIFCGYHVFIFVSLIIASIVNLLLGIIINLERTVINW